MNPAQVNRQQIVKLTDLPNIGPSMAADLQVIGIQKPAELIAQDPFEMYHTLCRITGVRHDLCVLDAFISITRFMDGQPAKPWWHFTSERKQQLLLKLEQTAS